MIHTKLFTVIGGENATRTPPLPEMPNTFTVTRIYIDDEGETYADVGISPKGCVHVHFMHLWDRGWGEKATFARSPRGYLELAKFFRRIADTLYSGE